MIQIYRLHYRAQLKENYGEQELADAVKLCCDKVRAAQRDGKMLTAALYRQEKMLFLYYEALGTPYETREGEEPSGEDLQAEVLRPEDFLASLSDRLQVWPGQRADRLWVHMYHIYYHDIPVSISQWRRPTVPEKRRGRIAFLYDDKLFGYVYYHKGLVDEGLIKGDRYQSIALHENILFSYFEEPRTNVNLRKEEQESRVLEEWTAVDPESHFIRKPGGGNFTFIPALFALGVEDMEQPSALEKGECNEQI